jgi:hypothetical protein
MFTGYTYIIFMIRQMLTLDTASPPHVERDTGLLDSALAVDAARDMVNLLTKIIALHSSSELLSSYLAGFWTHIPIACLYQQVLCSEDMSKNAKDIQSLEELCSHVLTITESANEFQPFAQALETLNLDIKRKTQKTID